MQLELCSGSKKETVPEIAQSKPLISIDNLKKAHRNVTESSLLTILVQ